MDPFGGSFGRHLHRRAHQPLTETLTAPIGTDTGTEQEAVFASVPCDIDEADGRCPLIGDDVDQATGQDVGKIGWRLPVPHRPPQGRKGLVVRSWIDPDVKVQGIMPRVTVCSRSSASPPSMGKSSSIHQSSTSRSTWPT